VAQVLTDDDELELEDQQRRKQQDPNAPIGSMPKPNPSSVPLPASMPPPDTGAAPTPDASTISGTAPYQPTAPRPESKAFTDWQAQDLAKHPVGQPRYHGLARVADTIAQMTWPGQAAEVGGEMGTLGAQAKQARLARGAAEENTQISYGEKEREANAKAEEEAVKTQGEETGNELVDVKLPDGTTTQVMRKNLASPTSAIINTAGREDIAKTNAGAKENVATTNAGAKEETAKIMVGGKALGTKEIQGPDGKAHVMMWNPTTHTYDKDLGEAPPKQAASSAYANTRTVQLLDPESGLPTVYQYNAATNSYDKPLGTSSTGAYGHEMAQAGAVERAGAGLIEEIKQNRDKIGDVGAIWNAAFMGTPLSDPYQSGLATRLASFAALNPALHGARGAAAMKEFEKIYGSPVNNPDSLIAAIEAGVKTAQYVNPKGKGSTSSQGAPGGGVSAPSSGKVIKYDSQGNRIQ
jgi:hypothetical protein